jgi:hypothetical protein
MSPQSSTASYEDEDDGELFGSECSEIETCGLGLDANRTAEANKVPVSDLDQIIFRLDDASVADEGSSMIRLGSLLDSAHQPVAMSCQQCNDTRLGLNLAFAPERLEEVGQTLDGLCDLLMSLDFGCHASRSGDSSHSSSPTVFIQVLIEEPPKKTHITLPRFLAHLVDVPIQPKTQGQRQDKSRRVTSWVEDLAQLVTDVEILLDDVCCERVTLPQKPKAEQNEFREETLKKVIAKRAEVLSATQDLQTRISCARPLTAKDRWLESMGRSGQWAMPQPGENMLPWAQNMSALWWGLPEIRRRDFRTAAVHDRTSLNQQLYMEQLQQLLEELDVVRGSLDPCHTCNKWDPWVAFHGIGACRKGLCKSCALTQSLQGADA